MKAAFYAGQSGSFACILPMRSRSYTISLRLNTEKKQKRAVKPSGLHLAGRNNFFCRGLDIRVAEGVEAPLLQSSRFQMR
jgi:hypothetical protein